MAQVDALRPKSVTPLPPPAAGPVGVQPMISVSGFQIAPVWGGIVNGGYTWQMTSTLQHIECAALGVIGCNLTDRWVTTIKIDPGNTSSRVTANSLYTPNSGRITGPV